MALQQIFLAELVVYDPGIPGTFTLRFATKRGLTTLPSETPASALYDARIIQPVDVTRDLFAGISTMGAARVGYGDLVLDNKDGQLDAMINYGFDGRALTVRQGDEGAAYPSGFPVVFIGTMEQVTFDADAITIKVRDRILETQVALQTTRYLGNNALPAGLEGVASDLKDKPKPVCLGKVRNITPVCVNTAKQIYQVNDGAIANVDDVRDNGLSLIAGFPLVMRTSSFGATAIDCVAHDGIGLFISGGASGTKLATSPDGIAWTQRTIPQSAVTCVVWASGHSLWVLGGNGLATSADGITWTARTSSFPAQSCFALAHGKGVTVAAGSAGTLDSSADSITWTNRTSSFGATQINGLAYGNNVFVAVGNSGKIATSPDGTTWTQQTTFDGAATIQAVAYGRGTFICVTSGGVVACSNDNGVTWTVITTLFYATSIQAITYANGLWVVCGSTGRIAVSADGFDWSMRTSGITDNLFGVAFGRGTSGPFFVFVGNAGKLGTSTGSSATYATLADLSDDSLAPPPGTYKSYLAGGYFRLGAFPAGLITADVTQGAAASDRKPGTLFTTLLTRAGKSSGDWSSGDVTTADALGYVLGYYAGPEEAPKVDDVLDLVAQSIGGWWGLDKSGIYRIKQLVVPSGTAVATLTENDIKQKPRRVTTTDTGHGLPVYCVTLQHTKNWTVQTSGVAPGISDADRALYALEYQTEKAETASVKTKHLLSPELIIATLLTSAADAATEAARIQTLRGTRRDPYEVVVEMNNETNAIDLGSIVDLTYAPNGTTRYGITGPKKMLALIVQPNAARHECNLTLWG